MVDFPFSAVLGQERLKLALVLCAIDPAIGGVLVRGPRGVGKTTLARAFSDLLPGRFVELPLGATEERVAGSLDLNKALGQRELEFSPGLLARAHDGVLYVDEVNLLPDALVDLLLDAAATGRNVVERDGVSHVHPARFVLIGTMNPEEGELRPQLCDRFGLSVTADNALDPDERARLVLRRLEFERDPERFAEHYQPEQRALFERCAAARARLAQLPFGGAGVARAAELCHAAKVDGVRADLAMLRAARAHAAWHEHDEILPSDVDAVAELALAHRRRGSAPGTGDPGSGGEGGPGRAHGSGREASPRGPARGASAEPSANGREGGEPARGAGGFQGSMGSKGVSDARAGRAGTDDPDPASSASGARRAARGPEFPPDALADGSGRGALRPVPVRSGPLPPLPLWLLEPAELRSRARAPQAFRLTGAGARIATQRRRRGAHVLGDGAIDWFATLFEADRRDVGSARAQACSDTSLPRSVRASRGRGSLSSAASSSEAMGRAPNPAPMEPACETFVRSPGEESARANPQTPAQPTGCSSGSVKRRPRRLARAGCWVLALDCSASMLQSGALSVAKGVARALAARAASASVRTTLVSFGGNAVTASAAATTDRARIDQAILSLGAAGGTPWRRAVQFALHRLTRSGREGGDRRLFIFTDGRTRERVDDLVAPHPDLQIAIIDCERGPLRLGRARRIAETSRARYVHIDWIGAG